MVKIFFGEWGMGNGEWGNGGMGNVKCEMWNAGCEMGNVKCDMGNVKWLIGIEDFEMINGVGCFINRLGKFTLYYISW
mgnify:CR=1 FL=1